MTNSLIIKERFSKMNNEQLFFLVKNEGQEMTGEALNFIYEEFISRKMDLTVFEDLEQHKNIKKSNLIEQIKDQPEDAYINSLWHYALDQKGEGKHDREIAGGLLERGLDEENIEQMLSSLKLKAKEFSDNYDTQMMIGGIACIAGMIITILTFANATSKGGYVFIAWGAIVFGAIRFFSGLSNKSKYKNIIKKLSSSKIQF